MLLILNKTRNRSHMTYRTVHFTISMRFTGNKTPNPNNIPKVLDPLVKPKTIPPFKSNAVSNAKANPDESATPIPKSVSVPSSKQYSPNKPSSIINQEPKLISDNISVKNKIAAKEVYEELQSKMAVLGLPSMVYYEKNPRAYYEKFAPKKPLPMDTPPVTPTKPESKQEQDSHGAHEPSKTPVIPNPPPLPSEPLTKPNKNNAGILEPLTNDTLANAKNNLKPFNPWKKFNPLNKSDIDQMKTPLKSVGTNMPYTTKITKESEVTKFTPEMLVEELLNRGLATKDDGSTASNILDRDSKEHQLGGSDYGIKLTALGQAYFKKAPTKQPSTTSTAEKIPAELGDNVTVGFTNNTSKDAFLKTGEQKHLLVLQPIENGYASPNYLTSKAKADVIADTQYRAHQTEMENITNGTNITIPDKWKLPQKFVPFNNLKIFEKEEIIIPKWADTYIKTHMNFETLSKEWKQAYNKLQQKYNPNGITKERALELCQAYDFIFYKKYSHPVTYDQELAMKKNKQNKLPKETNNKTTHDPEKE